MKQIKTKYKDYNIINIETWKRKEHYLFFDKCEKPMWGITTELNCTSLYRYCKTYGIPFFYYYLFLSLKAVNQVQALKYRKIDGVPVEFKQIDGSVTVLRSDHTFGFGYFDFDKNFENFYRKTKMSIDAEKARSGVHSIPDRINTIHYSVIPYMNITSIEHAQFHIKEDTIPKIVFGRIRNSTDQCIMPISIHTHHAFCDAYDIGLFLEKLQNSFEVS